MFEAFFKQNGTKCTFKKGEIIVDCNEKPNGIYLIEEGFVKAFALTERGNEHLYIIYKPGEVFPGRWAFSDIKGFATYVAMTEVVARKASKSKFTSFLNSSQENLLSALAYSNTLLDIFVDRVNDLEHMNAYLRVASRLLSLTRRLGRPCGEGILIEAPVTQQDIASSLGLTRETVSREMGKLVEKQLAGYKDQLLYINSIEKLEIEIREYSEN